MENYKVLITGPTYLSRKDFEAYYVPAIERAMQNESAMQNDSAMQNVAAVTFLVGGADGADAMTREYLAGIIAQDRLEGRCVTVYDKGQQNHSVVNVAGKQIVMQHVSGFNSYPERDAAMVALANDVIGFVYQYGGGGSGTMANILDVESKKRGRPLTGYEIVSIIRERTIDAYNQDTAQEIVDTHVAAKYRDVTPEVPLPEVQLPEVPRQEPEVAPAVPFKESAHNELTNKHRMVIKEYILMKAWFEAGDKPKFNEYIKSLRRFDQLNPVEKSLILNHENARGAKQRHYPALTTEEEDIVRKAAKSYEEVPRDVSYRATIARSKGLLSAMRICRM